jgi:hypothetical protein
MTVARADRTTGWRGVPAALTPARYTKPPLRRVASRYTPRPGVVA